MSQTITWTEKVPTLRTLYVWSDVLGEYVVIENSWVTDPEQMCSVEFTIQEEPC